MSKRRTSRRLLTEALEHRHLLAAQIVGHVWFDSDQSGSYSDAEVDVTNTEVRLLGSSGSILAEIVSDKDGDFEFDGLPAGDYVVEVIPPDGTDFTMPDMAGEPFDSDVDPATGRTAVVTLTDGSEARITVGLIAPSGTARITGRVWHDANANGIQDPDEEGIAGAEVQVENIHLEKILEVYTDQDGLYEVNGTMLPPGSYVLDFKRPPRDGGLRWEISPMQVAQVDDALNSDASTVNGKTDLFDLPPADEVSTPPDIELDAGFNRATFIRGFVGHDYLSNGDIYQVASFELRLLDAAGEVISTTSTNKWGNYEFLGLTAGEYQLEAVLPDGVSAATAGMDPVSGRSAPLVVSSSQGTYFDISVITELGTDSLTGRLWHDVNANGIQDPAEPGLANQQLLLENHRFTRVLNINTDENGDYEVDGSWLLPGEYVLSLKYLVTSIPTLDDYVTSWKVGPSQTGVADPTTDNDFQALSTRSQFIRLDAISSEEERGVRQIDGGLYRFGSVSGQVFDDENHDGIRNEGEKTVGRVAAEIWDADNQLVKTVHGDL